MGHPEYIDRLFVLDCPSFVIISHKLPIQYSVLVGVCYNSPILFIYYHSAQKEKRAEEPVAKPIFNPLDFQ